MKISVSIQTPKGQASKSEPLLRKMLLGLFKKETSMVIDQEDSRIVWQLDANHKQLAGLTRNSVVFEHLATGVISNFAIKRYLKRELRKRGDEQKGMEELLTMFKNTKITIEKEQTSPEEPETTSNTSRQE